MDVKFLDTTFYTMTWDEVAAVSEQIAMEAAKSFGPDLVVGIGNGGLIPAAIIASLLRIQLYPCLLTRKRRGAIVSDRPEVIVPVTDKVAGKRVLIVDQMVVTGETMRLVNILCQKQKPRMIRTACLWAQAESWKPTWYGLETFGYVAFPWDAYVLDRGRMIVNPIHQGYLDV